MPPHPESVDELARAVVAGDRRALARAITLLESSRAGDDAAAERLLDELAPHAGRSKRVAFTGPPGVGKSTLLDVFGRTCIERGKRVAVLAVDPSSARSGGSVLGDKTRMAALAAREESFIRPTPSSGERGGVAPRTREAMLACEAAGFDWVLVETVGVGQAEYDVVDLVDCVVLLVAPGAGDELQGMKRGILEFADVLGVTKADGVDRQRAERAAAELGSALALVGGSRPAVLTLSALEARGVRELFMAIEAFVAAERAAGRFDERRVAQDRAWFARAVERGLRSRLFDDAEIESRERELSLAVSRGEKSPRRAARELFELVDQRRRPG